MWLKVQLVHINSQS
uniref:Uncharacterized protein n=1 Tax=Anguilla anguilla TaxID=7936 RepID=A0A0E9Q681_ANGAN